MAEGADDGTATGMPVGGRSTEPQTERKEMTVALATMEGVIGRLRSAFERVASNKGVAGPDRQSIEAVREHLDEILPKLEADLLSGAYVPGLIRRVWIPKPGGGQRGLGIPNVVDRVVQEAVRQVLEPLYEPTFHPSSHGFRPNRSCHTAIAEAREYVEAGHDFVVDLDLEKFFDQVCHQRLMARLARRVGDRRLLMLVGRMLKAKVVMPDGIVVSTDEGVPQGGPLSPLLSNVVLDELDWELDRRGHRFVRYADDCNIYVRSIRAGQRVMASVSQFISKRLRLKVNQAKSAVDRPENRHFLGFSLRSDPETGAVEVLLSKRSEKRLDQRLRELTPRNLGDSLRSCISKINVYLRGWISFFGICTLPWGLDSRDAHIRRRLRAIQLKHWKRKRTIARKLISMGLDERLVRHQIFKGKKSLWSLSWDPVVHYGLQNVFFEKRGLLSLEGLWYKQRRRHVAPTNGQLTLFGG